MDFKIKKIVRKLFYKGIFKGIYEKLSEIRKNKNKKISDREYIIRRTIENTGLVPNIDNPKMLFEKVLWLKCYYKNPLMTLCTDKYEVKKYIKNKGYSNILMPNYGVFEKFEDIDFSLLPNKVFIKSTHTSGINQVFEKNKTNYKKAKKRFKNSLKTNYFYKSREWNYKNIKPRLIVEPFLNMEVFIDYKFFVIDGKVEYFAIAKDINDDKGVQSADNTFNLYYPNLKPFNGDVGRKKFNDSNFQFSKFINEMIKIAEDLSKPFVYCRVDFLVSKEKIIFGEITFFPTGGAMVLKPLSLEYYYGEKLNLEKIEKEHVY